MGCRIKGFPQIPIKIMRTYYCKRCQKSITFDNKELVKKCSCSYVFENNIRKRHEINMRNTWSGTTQLEFSSTTIDKSIERMNNG